MNLFGLLGVSGSALTAERVRAEVTASRCECGDDALGTGSSFSAST